MSTKICSSFSLCACPDTFHRANYSDRHRLIGAFVDVAVSLIHEFPIFVVVEVLDKLTDVRFSSQVFGPVFGLVASLITFRELWGAAGAGSPPPPPVVVGTEEKDRQGEKEAGATAQEVEPYAVGLDLGVSGSASAYVEVEAVQA
jgi:hypothetical protein